MYIYIVFCSFGTCNLFNVYRCIYIYFLYIYVYKRVSAIYLTYNLKHLSGEEGNINVRHGVLLFHEATSHFRQYTII